MNFLKFGAVFICLKQSYRDKIKTDFFFLPHEIVKFWGFQLTLLNIRVLAAQERLQPVTLWWMAPPAAAEQNCDCRRRVVSLSKRHMRKWGVRNFCGQIYHHIFTRGFTWTWTDFGLFVNLLLFIISISNSIWWTLVSGSSRAEQESLCKGNYRW